MRHVERPSGALVGHWIVSQHQLRQCPGSCCLVGQETLDVPGAIGHELCELVTALGVGIPTNRKARPVLGPGCFLETSVVIDVPLAAQETTFNPQEC